MSCPPLGEFHIGWICALPIEAAAARMMLDKDFGVLGEQDPRDSNVYRLGTIGKHNVVIACLPAGQIGPVIAATVVNNMVRTFSTLEFGIMVGIGGGIPSADHDIRLGDIVIGCSFDDSRVVVQHDTVKYVAGGELYRTGFFNNPPRPLLAATHAMRTAHLAKNPRYTQYMQDATVRDTRTGKTFSRPSAQTDRLFKVEYGHSARTAGCEECPKGWEVSRPERECNDPRTHYGIIASGSAVIKDGRKRENIRLKTGALCVEMEAAGMVADFHCLVIRGICDYSDSHKNKQWQGYAALAAAAYAKDLLGYVPKGNSSKEVHAKILRKF
ncbi:pfs domain-containing protein, variant [Blastomyces gilchristii SLH14081]|uniref:Pfs domain-containing protein, variant n=1 Tax=Blastomyces gilchristii (strain SLH14081) TaxID=559298 RepID=A0A179V0F5_BLAGS|nr:pfs domain-containing protein, variant [Blastomyces gilchristii SLH14081]OAT12082.1 pfs domain-containing protein, variant [Blastomyces gilchristii SLH14081]